MMRFERRWPLLLLALYALVFVWLGIAPVDRKVWLAENLTVLVPVAVLMVMYYRGVRFSNTAYTLMALFFMLHTVGGHFTFEKVPMDWLAGFLGWQRNHFDRICHFAVGFFAWPALEFLEKRRLVRGRWLAVILTVMGVLGFAACFEIFEWIYAELADPDSGVAFLGSQGDVWDAQKDMLADGIGALTTSLAYLAVRRNLPGDMPFLARKRCEK